MRILDLCRGVAACGKSTFLKARGLDRYALNADNVRLLFQSPVLQPDGTLAISQKHDKLVWELIFQLLEERMKRGEYTIIDATHSRAQQINNYKKLCEKYRYRCRVLDFSAASLEFIQNNNRRRLELPGEEHKYVPEGAILNMYERIQTQNPPGWVTIIQPAEYEAASALKLFDYNPYARVHIIGDLHGCLAPLQKYVTGTKGFDSTEDAWIFVGDYVDRGLQNRELLEYLMPLRDYKNVLFLVGNHDLWTTMYANDEIDEIKSKEFITTTMPQLASIDKKLLREWCRRLAQLAWFKFGPHHILVTHGGIPILPDIYTATSELIHGTGKYEAAEKTQDSFVAHTPEHVLQFHGHRNIFNQPLDHSRRVYNLCDKVEFGGKLRIACVDHAGAIELFEIQNTIFTPEPIEVRAASTTDELSVTEMIQLMRAQPKMIYEKRFDIAGTPNKAGAISSFNFTRDVFYDKQWTPATVLARGMFVNNQSGEIVARGYEKFFNINEREFTKLENLQAMQWPIAVYLKYNGFLGLYGWDQASDHAVITTKSSLTGNYLSWYKNLLASTTEQACLEDWVAKQPYCLVLEVIDPKHDPHIIAYPKGGVVLLDAIQRAVQYHKLPYHALVELGQWLRLPVKQHVMRLANYREFFEFYQTIQEYEYQLAGAYVEGFVFEDQAGFMTKAKTGYYNLWKFMRGVKDGLAHRRIPEMAKFTTALQNSVAHWLKQQDTATLQLDIITLRRLYYETNSGTSR